MKYRPAKPIKPPTAGILDALTALYKDGPLSDAERAQHRSEQARKDREAWQKIRGTDLQPDLLDGEGPAP